ncbi:MAG: hypothetical protein PHW52_02080 [Candidatus Pacebacteria bacterium]|nr:hypothetical protein [Candidatus Paceibacterota bacterium]
MVFEHLTPMGGYTPENIDEEKEKEENIIEISNELMEMIKKGSMEEAENKMDTLDDITREAIRTRVKDSIKKLIFEGDLGLSIDLQNFFGCYDDFLKNEEILEIVDLAVEYLGKDQENTEKVENLNNFFHQNKYYEKEAGFNEMINRTEALMKEDRNILVTVAGGSASGKTSFAAEGLRDNFKDSSQIISMDNYYKGASWMAKQKEQGREISFDEPDAIDIELLEEDLKKLLAGESVEMPKYSFTTGEREGYEQVNPKKLIILEGLFANYLKDADLGVFVNTSSYGRILRRLFRDVERTGQDPKDILSYFIKIVEPLHKEYIQKNEEGADIVIENEYDPIIEAERTNMKERQVKIKERLSPKELRRLGAERIGKITQIDSYFKTRLPEEILRVRKEGQNYYFTYKGPEISQDGEERVKNKFEFEIDGETVILLEKFYGEPIERIIKEREIYNIGDNIISQDEVYLESENGEEEDKEKKNIGSYMEIRIGKKNNLDEILKTLGLENEKLIKESYFDICKKVDNYDAEENI